MTDQINEKIVTISIRCNQASKLHRPIIKGNRFNLTINGNYYPASIESVSLDFENPVIQLKVIMNSHFSGLPKNQTLELREGANIFASCEFISIDSIDDFQSS